MSHIISSETLILLRPDYLLKSHKLSESKDKICTVLNLLRQALAETSYQQALITVNHSLEILGSVEVIETGEIPSTNTSLEPWEIEDYDQFFGLKHVQARDPAVCLVASIITAYRALLELNRYTSLESVKLEVETQRMGFKSCVSLFARVFNLCLEEMP